MTNQIDNIINETFDILHKNVSEQDCANFLSLYKNYEKQYVAFPASIKWHHTEKGGYARHVREVMGYVIKLSEAKKDVPRLVRLAFIHDIDKLERYEIDSESPTLKQVNYAAQLGIVADKLDSKSSLSTKINNKVNNLNDPIQYFKYCESQVADDSAKVMRICFKLNIELDDEDVHCLCTHHGGWSNAGQKGSLSPIATILHCADLMSTNILGKNVIERV